MKFAVIGISTSWIVMASDGITGSTGYVQYGALGLLAFVIVWLLTKGFPAMIKAQKQDRDLFRAAIYVLRREIRLLRRDIRKKDRE